MHTLRLAVPAEAAAQRPTGKSEASGEAGSTGFLAILSAVRHPGGESVPDGTERPVRLLAGEQPGGKADAEAKARGQWVGGSALRTALLRSADAGTQSADAGGTAGQGGKQAAARTGGNAKGTANGKGTSTPTAKVTTMPVRPSGARPAAKADGTKQVHLLQNTSSEGPEGQVRPGGAPESTKGRTAKEMPTPGRAAEATKAIKNGQPSGEPARHGGNLREGGRPRRPGAKSSVQSSTAALRETGAPRGEAGREKAGRPQGKASGARAQAGTDGKHGQNAAFLSTTKSATANPERRAEGAREALSQERPSRSGRNGRATGRQAQGRAGQQGGGHQKGGQHGQGGGQNGAGQHGAGPNSPGAKAKNPASPPSFSLSSSNASSGESDANALRASLSREASTTGSGLQGTDGKGTGASGTSSGAAGAKASGRSGGGAGSPRTMPSAWLNAAKQGTLRTAELAGGWKAMELSLGEDKGTMTVKARQGQEHMAVSVGFSDTRVQAQVVANARQLQDAMQAQYGTDVDLSFGGEGDNGSDQQTAEGGGPDRSATLASGEADADEDGNGTTTLRSGGRREWIG